MAGVATAKRVYTGEALRVRGLVQGVGFRPTVYRLARELELDGEVRNDGEGVLIQLLAPPRDVAEFIDCLRRQCPPLAHIDAIERQPLETDIGYRGFRIGASLDSAVHTGIVADAATCDACLEDISAAGSRRHGYAFTNCTHCGPRLSIVRGIPYDRALTSMANFELCEACAREYTDPADRRFHAQPNACPECGPRLTLCDRDGRTIAVDDVIDSAARLLEAGNIVAIKGIGGFQLACDAASEDAVAELRRRKRRPHKSLALLARDCEQVARYCPLGEAERELLQSSAAPILVLQRGSGLETLAAAVAPAQNTYGFMLPCSPLHHLLMARLERPIVLTSGNAAEEPQCIDNEQALERLGGIADYFVMHDRAIVNRVDDSVVRLIDGRVNLYRRARGFAPAPLPLPREFAGAASILACGGELKNTFCLLADGQAILSQHIGNLSNALAFDDYLANLALYRRLFRFDAGAIAVDRHPEYLSSKHGAMLARQSGLPLVAVQHHHAHVAACMADNGWESRRGPVIGIALDGLGHGDDGSVWGGEFMLADYRGFERLARLKPVPMLGADRAALEPWRNAYAQLRQQFSREQLAQRQPPLGLLDELRDKPLALVDRMLSSGLNSPPTSSCGRLFDAVAAVLRVCPQRISYEGQAAIELEALLAHDESSVEPYPFDLQRQGELLEIDSAPMWRALLADIDGGREKSYIAARFHLGLARIVHAVALRLCRETGVDTVALSGGVLQNPSLLRRLNLLFEGSRTTTLLHRDVPVNDGGLALGQAVVAAARLDAGETS